MKRTCFLLIILLFSSLHGMSNAWNSFVQNFDKKLYGQGSQTWQVSPYDNRWTFFANKKGLLQFDGNEWKTFQMNNQFDVRSVLSSSIQKRIYVGGVNEYGYYEPDEIGNLKYHCMSDTLDDISKYIGNVWGIQELDNILYFQGDRRVIKWVNENYTPIDVDAKIDCSNVVRGTLYLGTDKGVWVLIGNRFTPLQGAEKLTSMRIRGFLPYKEGMLIVTAYNGLYYFDGFNTTPFLTGLESFMRENEVFCVAMRENTIALGTIHRGILLIDCNTLDVKYINEFSGLYNNTVLSLSFDESGNLWAGLDNGISYIYLNSPYTSLYAYPNSFGTGYSATVLDTKLYLGTNRGLYSTAYPVQFGENKPNIEAIPHSSGQVWNLCKVGNELFCSHDRGLFQLKGTVLQRIGDITGVWLCKPVLNNPDLMFVGTYLGLYLAKRVHNNWTIAGKINDMNDSCRFFEQESETIIWYHNVNHVVRIELTPDLMQINNSKSYYPKDGLPENSTICLTKVKGEVYFATSVGIYKYNSRTDRIEPYKELYNPLVESTNYLRFYEYNKSLISLTPFEICIANSPNLDEKERGIIYPINNSLIALVPTFESLVPIEDSLLVIPNENGFALLTHSLDDKKEESGSTVFIKKMYAADSLVYVSNYLNKKPPLQLSYEQNSIRFEYGLSYCINDQVRYQYRLNNEEWSAPTTTSVKVYSQLYEGNHQFEVKTLLFDGSVSVDSIEFNISPPWYRNTIAYVVYFLLLLLVGWIIYYWDNTRINRSKRQAVVEKERELLKLEEAYEKQKEETERQIMLLEKEKLEYELQHKSQEIANLMINVVRKNDMLTDIKSEIQKVVSQLKPDNSKDSKQQLIIINNKIESNIQSDEVLKRIEAEFDLLHNNFMKRLGTKHPELSNNERMMCAYLKMKLSTKEIAPLLSISVRGVETIRYRLRKKFNLEREDSLTDYLENQL